jgi:hypothetical protein
MYWQVNDSKCSRMGFGGSRPIQGGGERERERARARAREREGRGEVEGRHEGCLHLKVSSRMNISHAFAKRTGASAEIIRTSSSLFMILLIRAKGRSLCVLKSWGREYRRRNTHAN